jgi:hypothetical protein
LSNIVWIGPRESDIQYTGDFFKGSITLYGKNKYRNSAFCATKDYRINHNHITAEQTLFMNNEEINILQSGTDVKFMSYNPVLMDECTTDVQDNTLCYNDKKTLKFFNSKINFRKLSRDCVPTLHSEMIKGCNCKIDYLKTVFPKYSSFIIQADIASGGYGTYILEQENESRIIAVINNEENYLVSPYYQNNIPINMPCNYL